MCIEACMSSVVLFLSARLHFKGLEVASIDDQRRNRTANAIVDALSQHVVLAGSVEVECSGSDQYA